MNRFVRHQIIDLTQPHPPQLAGVIEPHNHHTNIHITDHRCLFEGAPIDPFPLRIGAPASVLRSIARVGL
jgi:hypothetical protein